MKYIRNNEADGVLDRLLKAEMGRVSRTGTPCSQFDPDLSAAYIERNLTPGETSRYEVHLASCQNCRILVAGLARTGYQPALEGAGAEIAFSPSAPPVLRERRLSLSRVWAYLLQPQWIAVGTAALILLVALPIFIMLKNARQQSPPQLAAAKSPPSDAADVSLDGQVGSHRSAQPAASNETAGSNRPESRTGSQDRGPSAPVGNPGPRAEETGGIAKNGNAEPAPALATPADSPSLSPAPEKDTGSQRNEAESRQSAAGKVSESTQIAQNLSQNSRSFQQSNSDQARVTPAPEGAAQQKQQAGETPVPAAQDDKESGKGVAQAAGADQISAKDAQTLPDDNSKKAASVTVIRPGGVGPDSARAKERAQTIRPKDSEPPKAETTRDEPDRRSIASGPAREFANRGRADADTVRKQPASPALARGQKLERRVENKRFRLQAGIWTDRDFKPAKEIPAITLIRDGELYKSALEKQPGLKPLLAGFGPDERLILVYKNIIYKIFPSKN